VDDLLLGLALFLLANLVVGLVVVARASAPETRMLAAQLFGTTSVAILLVLADALETPAARDVALVFALLAAVAAIAFGRRVLAGRDVDRR
jgi:multicomponent Na+:H+ antiporter subunit F